MAQTVKKKKTVTTPEEDDYTIGAFIVIGVIILIIVGIVLFIFNVFPLKRSDVVTCTSQSCFDTQFSQCKQSTWVASDPSDNAVVSYKITGKVGDKCGIEFTSSTEKGVRIACNLDNSVSFADAQTLAENNPSNYKCRKV